MLASLASSGYTVTWRVLNAADFGHPQKRKRTFIFAHLGDEPIDIFGGPFATSEPFRVNEFELDKDLVKISNSFNMASKATPFQTAGSMHNFRVRTWKYMANKTGQKTLADILVSSTEVPDDFWVRSEDVEKWEYLKGAKALSRAGQNGYSYSYSEGSMVFPDSLDRPARTIVTGEGGATPSRFKHVIRQDGRLRRLVPVELERANEFPDDWTKFAAGSVKVPDARRAFLMGNALVVGLVAKLAEQLRKSHEAQ
jgi:DNA (cytosine-5)-methyltransferase 1